jgi:hypothetical protein
MRLPLLRNVVLAVLLLGLITSAPTRAQQIEGLAEHIAAVEKACKELQQKRKKAEEALKSAQLTPDARKKAETDFAVLQRVAERTQKLMAKPPGPSRQDREDYARTLSSALAEGSIASSRLQLDLGHAPVDALQRAIKSGSFFDGASPIAGAAVDVKRRDDTDFFMLRHGGMDLKQGIRADAAYASTTTQDARDIVKRDGHIGGGIMLEENAPSLGRISSVHYDPDVNALTLNNRAYFLPMDSWTAAQLCRAIAEDYDAEQKVAKDRIGVSLTGKKYLIFGKSEVYQNTAVVDDLLVADRFLGDVIFGGHDWSRRYRFPDRFAQNLRKTFW